MARSARRQVLQTVMMLAGWDRDSDERARLDPAVLRIGLLLCLCMCGLVLLFYPSDGRLQGAVLGGC